MIDCKTRFIGWLLHDWKSVLIYPPSLSDGEGGCWAGHLIQQCNACGKKRSNGIWAASETLDGKHWAYMRAARPDEFEGAFQVLERV